MKELVHTGVGTTVKQAEVILPEHEEKLWETGVLCDHSAESLQYTVYYYSFKIYGLRSCDEHRSLECTQFTVGKMMAIKNTFALSDEVTKLTRVVLLKFNRSQKISSIIVLKVIFHIYYNFRCFKLPWDIFR